MDRISSAKSRKGLDAQVDAVVMLTQSDWHTELRSNRYHWASRFAGHLPVIFVQPDLRWFGFELQQTELERVTILRVPALHGPRQSRLLMQALRDLGVQRPLLWIYNHRLSDFVRACPAAIRIYHATEDYFCSDFYAGDDLDEIRYVLGHCDLVVAVSDGVLEDYREKGGYSGPAVVLSNGCDFGFWSDGGQARASGQVALYQGGISQKVDLELLVELAGNLSDWQIHIYGRDMLPDRASRQRWQQLCALPNVRYGGVLQVAELKPVVKQATVGLIPYVQNDWIIRRSFPLKAFEYLACGLPVVSVPIDSLQPFPGLFHFARDADGFTESILRAARERDDPAAVTRRLQAAEAQDYGAKFAQLWEGLDARRWPKRDVGGVGEPLPRKHGGWRLGRAVYYQALTLMPRFLRQPVATALSAVRSKTARILRRRHRNSAGSRSTPARW